MRATLIYGAGDVRVENVPDATLREPTDALVRVLQACICGSDLWPYGSMDAAEEGDCRVSRQHPQHDEHQDGDEREQHNTRAEPA